MYKLVFQGKSQIVTEYGIRSFENDFEENLGFTEKVINTSEDKSYLIQYALEEIKREYRNKGHDWDIYQHVTSWDDTDDKLITQVTIYADYYYDYPKGSSSKYTYTYFIKKAEVKKPIPVTLRRFSTNH